MRSKILLLIAFLEWFTTLAFQMVALRKAIPFVGSSVVLTSVVLWIILLALSAWYFVGWSLTSSLSEDKLLRRLQLYLIVSWLYYLLIVYPSFSRILQTLLSHIWFIPTLFAFALIFFAVPTFLASHTMPIITHVSSWTKGYAAGKILFISTLWSFLGSTITTLILFPNLGVYWTWICTSIILFICWILIYPPKYKSAAIIFLLCFMWLSISSRPIAQWRYEDTAYQTLRVLEWKYKGKLVRLMQLNGGWASGIEEDTKKSFFPYVRQMVNVIENEKPKNVAVIGAAWCTLPQEIAHYDFITHIDVVDIDPRVFQVAEDVFLQEKLNKKINPITQSARGRIYDQIKAWKQYDMVIVDAYNGSSIPEELLTKEFFAWLHAISPKLMINVITDRNMQSEFSQWLLHTLSISFPDLYAFIDESNGASSSIGNIVISNFSTQNMNHILLPNTDIIYTDDKNSADALRVGVVYGN